MSRKELEELFGNEKDDEKKYVSAASLVNISNYAIVDLRMDDKTLDYFYEIDINELLDSEMPIEEYKAMKEQGWFIENDKLKIFI